MRPYDHDPDLDFIREELDFESEGIEVVQDVIARQGPDQVSRIFNILHSASWAAAYAWALGGPVDEIRGLLRPGIQALHQGLDAGIAPDNLELAVMIPVPLIAGDRAGAIGLANLARALELRPEPNDTADRQTRALALLVLDQPEAAREDVDAIAATLDSPAMPADLAPAFTHVPEMFRAVIERDQQGWLAATAARATLKANIHRVSLQARRDVHGLIDFTGVALCRLAQTAGMPLPDQPIFAADLIREL